MCDPITLILGAVSAAGAAMSMKQPKAAPPPPPAAPVLSPPVVSEEETKVQLGTDDEPINTKKNNTDAGVFQRRRISANTFGNLGKSALEI